MTDDPPARCRDRSRSLVGAAILVATAAVTAGAACIGGSMDTPGAPAAVGFAAAVCLAGSLGGWILARWPAAIPSRRVSQGLAGSAVRLFLPLFALGWIETSSPRLRDAGAAKWLLIFYLVLLAVDIFLTIIGGDFAGKNTGQSTGKNSAN